MTIQSHLYASKPETPVFPEPKGESIPVHVLHRGNWLGVLERINDWIRVIGIECQGWVRAEDVEERPPFSLHAFWSPGKPIEYVSTTNQ